ncbi:MAG: 4a-hydroxytetrahydrobiopterin dehydratase [Chloroflexi bacterium]|jgi:4a-hydroxytetrahydrobiopterin dehydratase|nr:4a-hydroxytetrahydrobiopterin dehydratase [Chloroflexota bacterium]
MEAVKEALTDQEIDDYRYQAPRWTVVVPPGGEKRLERNFQFPNFIEALDFAIRVGEMAEEENHHPRLVIEWGSVTVSWWTHEVRGLLPNDFQMAAKTDTIFAEF